MQAKKKYLFLIILLLTIVLLLYFIKSQDIHSDTKALDSPSVEIGRYITKDNLAWLELKDDHQFIFCRNMATSYWPSGTYEIVGDLLILRVENEENNIIEFLIHDQTIAFKSGQLVGNLIEENEVFYYEPSPSDYRPMISKKDFLYFDTGLKKSNLSEEWVEIGELSTVIDPSMPMPRGQSYYVANDFLVGNKIYARKQNYETLYVSYENQFYEYVRQEDAQQLSKDQKYVAGLEASVEDIKIKALSDLLQTSKDEFIKAYGPPKESLVDQDGSLEMDITTLSYDFAQVTFIPSFTDTEKDVMTKLVVSGPQVIGPYELKVGDSLSKIFEVLPKVEYGKAYVESIFSDGALDSFTKDAGHHVDLIYITEDLKDIAYLIYNPLNEIIGVKYIMDWETGGFTLLNFSIKDRIITTIEIQIGFM